MPALNQAARNAKGPGGRAAGPNATGVPPNAGGAIGGQFGGQLDLPNLIRILQKDQPHVTHFPIKWGEVPTDEVAPV